MTSKERLAHLKAFLEQIFPTAQIKLGWPKSFPNKSLLITYSLGQKTPTTAIGNQRVGAWQNINLNIWASTELQCVKASEILEDACNKTEYGIVTINTVHETGVALEWRKSILFHVYEKQPEH